ncbi:MAG TPA: hypothetical protein VNY84_09910, partial [Acidimicrobiales bacterium]|nr:hypothetical protein [Acidimicrobiales bacterium]
ELLMRTAAVYVAVLFLPIVLAGLVWPATLRWARRLVELLAVLILSKFVIVAVLSLAASALADGVEHGGLAALLSGASLLLLAAFAPYTLLRLVPFVEAGAANHLEGVASSLPARAANAARTPGNVVDDLLGRSGDFAPPGGAGTGASDVRTSEGARQLSANPAGLHIADPATFDATRAAGAPSASSAASAPAAAEAGAGLGTAMAAPAALLAVGHGVATAAKERAAGAVDGLGTGLGVDSGD